jgi:hypothetical protein
MSIDRLRRGKPGGADFVALVAALFALLLFPGTALAEEDVPVPALDSTLGTDVSTQSPPEEALSPTAMFESPVDTVPALHEGTEPLKLVEHPELALSSVSSDASAFRSDPVRVTPLSKRGDRAYVLPLSKSLISAGDLDDPHHDYPAWDIGVAMGTPVYSVTSGTVTQATYDGRCGTGVEVRGTDGMTYLYCHGSSLATSVGASVKPGELIMLSGDSGHSTAPHLHLQIANGAGALVCPQAPLASWYSGGEMSPAGASSSGCWYATPEGADKEKPMNIGHGPSGGGYFVPDGAEPGNEIDPETGEPTPGTPGPGAPTPGAPTPGTPTPGPTDSPGSSPTPPATDPTPTDTPPPPEPSETPPPEPTPEPIQSEEPPATEASVVEEPIVP